MITAVVLTTMLSGGGGGTQWSADGSPASAGVEVAASRSEVSGRSSRLSIENRAQYLMGTSLEIEAPRGIDEAFAEAARVEELLTTWGESELTRLNKSGTATVSGELHAVLQKVMEWRTRTGGAFNPLVRPLIDAWKTREEGALPPPEVLRETTTRVNTATVRIEAENRIVLENGATIEEGAFGKGYAIDRMLALLPDRQVMINFGGQIAVRGTREVTIAHPRHRDRAALSFTLENASLSTSAGSEKHFRIGNNTFTHIIDPRTGQALPPRGSVSVVAPDALTADILSTALYVMGPDEGLRWSDASGVAALFLTTNNELRMSSAFRRQARELRMLDSKFTQKD